MAGQAQPPIPAFAFEQDLLEEWKGKGAQVEEIGRRGTLLENLIVEITAPDTPSKAGESQPGSPEDASFLGALFALAAASSLSPPQAKNWGYFPFLTNFRGPEMV